MVFLRFSYGSSIEPFAQERLVVQAPAQPGSSKVLRGRGVPRCDASGRGNLVLHFLLHLPKTLSPRQAAGSGQRTQRKHLGG